MQAVECLAAVAEGNPAHVRVLGQSGCVDAFLSVISHASPTSKTVRSTAVLLHFVAQHQSSVR